MQAAKKFYFSDGPYHAVLHGVHAALVTPDACIKIIGDGGSGKSTFCANLARFLEHKGFHALYVDFPFDSPEQLRTGLAERLQLAETFNFSRQLEDFLSAETDDAKRLVLLFDDCHEMSDSCLLEIYRIANVQQSQHRRISILLCGEPQLDDRLLADEKFKPLVQYVSNSFILHAMDKDNLCHFFDAYFISQDKPGLSLSSGAQRLYIKLSRGFPGRATAICRLILEARRNDHLRSQVKRDELMALIQNSAASGELLSSKQFYKVNRLALIGPAIAVVIVLSLGLLYQQTSSVVVEQSTVDAIAEQLLTTPSPFLENQPAAPVENDVPSTALVQLSLDDTPEPIIDAGLELVTALERGIRVEQIVTPVFESISTATTDAIENSSDGITSIAANPDASLLPVAETAIPVATPTVESTEPPVQVEAALIAQTLTEPEFQGIDAVPEVSPTVAPVLVAQTLQITADPADSVSAASEDSGPDSSLIRTAVSAWLAAWQEKNLDSYFASYHEEFAPRYQDDRAAWQENRRRVIGNAQSIRLAITDYSIIGETEAGIEVSFWLRYQAVGYSDNTFKRLVFRPVADQWLIVEEVNLEVRR